MTYWRNKYFKIQINFFSATEKIGIKKHNPKNLNLFI